MKLVIRHGLSEANNRNNIGNAAFGHADAGLMEKGREQALHAAKDFALLCGREKFADTVAISEMRRTQETARAMGFSALQPYSVLDEVAFTEDKLALRTMLDNGELPDAAIEKAYRILENPPQEDVWVTHGLVIAGLCKILNVHQQKRLIPYFCEIRELPIENK